MDSVIAIVSVTGGRFTTHVGHYAGDDEVLNLEASQDSLQISIIESGVAMFGDHLLPLERGDFIMHKAFGSTFKTGSLPPPLHDAGVDEVGVVDMASVDDRSAGGTKSGDKSFYVWENGGTPAGKCGRGGVEEEFLHVDHKKGGTILIEIHNMCINGTYFLEPGFGLDLKIFRGNIGR